MPEAVLREEAALARAKFAALLDSMSEGLLVLDAGQRLTGINLPARRLLNRDDSAPLLGQPLSEVSPELGHLPLVAQIYQHRAEPPEGRETRFSLGKRTLAATLTPLHAEGLEFAGVVIVLRDSTHQEEAVRLRRELISVVSHELRSPLASIKGYMDLVLAEEAGTLSRQQKRFLLVISQSIRQLVEMVNNLLDLERLEAEHYEFQMAPLDLRFLATFALVSVKPEADRKHLHLELGNGDPLPVWGDLPRLQQAVLNLVYNAVKYTPAHGKVMIWTRREEEWAVLGVTDNGPGIAVEEQARVFDRFWRTGDLTLRALPGSGLGLSIVKTIIDAHHGHVSLESEPGCGSTFSFRLPLHLG